MAEKRPFRAYSGKGKYLFASYSHSDSKKVYEVLEELFCSGCNIWYDQGIPNNSVMDRQISKAIDECSLFVIFLSKSSTASKYVMGKELPQARRLGRRIVFVRLYEDDRSDYSAITGSTEPVSCGMLDALVPAECRDCRRRDPEPILVDMTKGMDFSKNQLVAAEYYFENNELVLSGYLNLGAVNDDKEEIDVLYVPDHIAGYPVRRIKGSCVFDELVGETETLVLPETLIELGSAVFQGSEFESIILPPSLKRIGDGCFASSPISDIDIPYGVEYIGEEAFADCEELEQIVLPETVKRIESCAFADCTSLESITIPPQTADIADDIFGDDEDISVTVYCVQGSAAHKLARKHGIDFELVSEAEMQREQNGMREKSRRMMESFEERRKNPNGTERKERTKTACILTDEADTAAIQPLLDDLLLDGISFKVLYEPDGTLSDYDAVVMILSETSCAKGIIPAAAPGLGETVYPIMLNGGAAVPAEFRGRFVVHQNDRTFEELCGEVREWLAARGCAEKNMRTSSIGSDFRFSFEESGEVWLKSYSGRKKEVIIPESWLGLAVTGITGGAFSHRQDIESVVVSGNVRTIEYYAFRSCPGLHSIVIPPCVTEIEDDAIYGCPNAAISGETGSEAQRYAEKEGIPFKAVRFPADAKK